MSARIDPAALTFPGLLVDASGRASSGIRISLSRPVRRRRSQRHWRTSAFRAGQPDFELPATDRLRALEYVVVDVETTGGSFAKGHRITEVCAIRLRGDGTRAGEFTTLVNPLRPIPPGIVSLTRITQDMVSAAPYFDEIAEPLASFIEGAVFVAHNAAFDWRCVTVELERAGVRVPACRVLCSLRLARRVVPEVARRSLDALSRFFGIENEARHRAFGDARATARIFRRLLDRVDEREIFCWEELETLMRRRAPRRKRSARPQPVTDA